MSIVTVRALEELQSNLIAHLVPLCIPSDAEEWEQEVFEPFVGRVREAHSTRLTVPDQAYRKFKDTYGLTTIEMAVLLNVAQSTFSDKWRSERIVAGYQELSRWTGLDWDNSNNLKSGNLLQGIDSKLQLRGSQLNVEGWARPLNGVKGKARTVMLIMDQQLREDLSELLNAPYDPNAAVYIATGEKFNPRRPSRNKQTQQSCQMVMERKLEHGRDASSFPEIDSVMGQLNGLEGNWLASRVLKHHEEALEVNRAREIIDKASGRLLTGQDEERRRSYAEKHLHRLVELARGAGTIIQPYYLAKRTDRLIPVGVFTGLPSALRNVILQGCQSLDLSGFQVAAALTVWNCDRESEILEAYDYDYWNYLAAQLNVDRAVAKTLKTATYATLYGCSEARRGGMALDHPGFWDLPVVSELVQASQRRVDYYKAQQGLITKWSSFKPRGWKAENSPRGYWSGLLPVELQSLELQVMLPVLQTLLTKAQGIIYLYDGVYVDLNRLSTNQRSHERMSADLIKECQQKALMVMRANGIHSHLKQGMAS